SRARGVCAGRPPGVEPTLLEPGCELLGRGDPLVAVLVLARVQELLDETKRAGRGVRKVILRRLSPRHRAKEITSVTDLHSPGGWSLVSNVRSASSSPSSKQPKSDRMLSKWLFDAHSSFSCPASVSFAYTTRASVSQAAFSTKPWRWSPARRRVIPDGV